MGLCLFNASLSPDLVLLAPHPPRNYMIFFNETIVHLTEYFRYVAVLVQCIFREWLSIGRLVFFHYAEV